MNERLSEAGRATHVPTVSVVIPTFRRRDGILRVLRPLLVEPSLHEAVVVVDGCRDGSLELLQHVASVDSRVKPIYTENVGAGGARALGVCAAGGQIVLVLDDDVIADPGLVIGHARHHLMDSNLVVVGYMPVATPERSITAAIYSDGYERVCREYERDASVILTRLWGGNISLSKALAVDIGFDSEAYNAEYRYNLDRDFGLRCRERGLVGLFDRRLSASHEYDRSLRGFRRDARSEGGARRVLHQRYGDVLGPFPPDDYADRGLPKPLDVLVRGCDRRLVYAVVSTALTGGVAVCGAARFKSGESTLARLLWRVEQRRALTAPQTPSDR